MLVTVDRPKLERRARLTGVGDNRVECDRSGSSPRLGCRGRVACLGRIRHRLIHRGVRRCRRALAASGIRQEREQTALKLIAVSFFVLGAYVAIEAVRDFIGDTNADTSPVGIGLAIASLLVMPALAVAKKRTGVALGNRTVIADAAETKLCTYLSAILLVGLVLDATLHWWWADPVAALGVAFLAVREGREAWAGDDCC